MKAWFLQNYRTNKVEFMGVEGKKILQRNQHYTGIFQKAYEYKGINDLRKAVNLVIYGRKIMANLHHSSSMAFRPSLGL